MRVNRVTMAGFGPYKTAQTVDFDGFTDDGIFLIGGKTGAGKSTILDAICFALYGSVPRYEGQASAATKLRSDHCAPDDPSYVELEFTVGNRRYRLRRAPEYERPKARGGGVTTQKAEAALFVQDGDDRWVGLEAQLRTVGVRVGEIVQLSQEQFLQVILLAQNRFQEFLLAKSDERQSLLRTLFGTRRFDDYDDALQSRRKALGDELGSVRGEVARLSKQLGGVLEVDGEAPLEPAHALEWMGGHVAAQTERVAAAALDAERTDAAWHAARAEHDRLAELQKTQRRRVEAEARRDALTEASARLDEQAARALADAGTHLGELGSLDAAAAGLAELTGSLAPGLEAEKSLPALERAITAAESTCEESDAAVDAAKQRAAEWKTELEELGPRLDEAVESAGDQGAAQHLLDGIGPVLTALAAAEKAQAALDAAQRRELESGRARTAASAALDELRARRLDGHAAELAAALSEGEPCPVCGATQHPAKAGWSGEPVTEADLEAAEATLVVADADASRATNAVAEARARLAQLQGAAAGHTTESALQLKTAASARLETAKAAAQRATQLRARRDGLTAKLAGHEAELEKLRARCDAANAQLTTARAAVEHGRKAVEAARGGFATVTERATALGVSLRAVREAMKRRQEHDAALVAVEATLADPAVRDAPAEPVELDGAKQALSAASGARDAARDARATLAAHLTTAEGLLSQARAAHESSAALEARFEVVQRLANTVHGLPPNTMAMRLESFVLAAELEEIVLAANARLRQMTGGRYLLEHSDERAARGAQSGLGLAILDQHTGVARPTQSLSGGETFLASLALALGLAEVVTGRAGGITLDTLFIDEGFGSLDSETLEIAMGTLDSLRAGGRTIGLISHVEAMKEQIPAKLQVEMADGGWSVITQ
jgi:exonuclease SbcC